MLKEGKDRSALPIKEVRLKYNLTIKQVSDMTGVPYRTLQNWEAGVRTPPEYVTRLVIMAIENAMNK